jgi:cyclic peptide transporter
LIEGTGKLHLLRLVRSGFGRKTAPPIRLLALSALANSALIGLVNYSAELAAFGEPIAVRLVFLYLILFLIFAYANSLCWRRFNRVLQQQLSRLRVRIADKVRVAPLRNLEEVDEGELLAAVNHETNMLSANLPLLTGAVQSVFLVLAALLYIATVSLVAFAIVVVVSILGAGLFWQRRKAMNTVMTDVLRCEGEVLTEMIGFTRGFKEIKLHAARSDALFGAFCQSTEQLRDKVIGVAGIWTTLIQFSGAFTYALLGILIFLVPIYTDGYTDVVFKLVAAAAFCLGPLASITSVGHLFASAEVGLGRIASIEQRLAGIADPEDTDFDPNRFRALRHIRCENICFAYDGSDRGQSFSTGPWSLDIKAGEILFVTGGNGSGKSTAMKLISGLYAPDAGRILVDGQVVTPELRSSYREVFAAIFADFHLFDRLYGLEDISGEKVQRLISRMKLEGKVEFEGDRFSTQALSTGQRKRLAMIVALLEDRDVYIFDEWAADQDAHFRDVFYKELLPELKERGKAVIAVTHDDRYWSYCDRRIGLDLGQIDLGAA